MFIKVYYFGYFPVDAIKKGKKEKISVLFSKLRQHTKKGQL